MARSCPSSKRAYLTQQMAEDVLIDLWNNNDYATGQGPVNIYQCEDCGMFHLTSKGETNEKLKKHLAEGNHRLHRTASRWKDKFKNW